MVTWSFERLPAAVHAPHRHWPSAAGFRGPENRRGSCARFARCRGEYGCASATDVRRNYCLWWFEIYADHRDRTRREESPRRFSCFAARGPLQTAAAAQHRHGAGGQRSAGSIDGAFDADTGSPGV